jgi:hypothetical protein
MITLYCAKCKTDTQWVYIDKLKLIECLICKRTELRPDLKLKEFFEAFSLLIEEKEEGIEQGITVIKTGFLYSLLDRHFPTWRRGTYFEEEKPC